MIRTPLPLNKAIISQDPNGTYADELNDKHYKEIVMDDHLSLLKQQNGSLLVITSIIAVQFSATMICSGASNPPFLERQGRSCELLRARRHTNFCEGQQPQAKMAVTLTGGS